MPLTSRTLGISVDADNNAVLADVPLTSANTLRTLVISSALTARDKWQNGLVGYRASGTDAAVGGKITAERAVELREQTRAAMQPLLEDQIASSIDVGYKLLDDGIDIEIIAQQHEDIVRFDFRAD